MKNDSNHENFMTTVTSNTLNGFHRIPQNVHVRKLKCREHLIFQFVSRRCINLYREKQSSIN